MIVDIFFFGLGGRQLDAVFLAELCWRKFCGEALLSRCTVGDAPFDPQEERRRSRGQKMFDEGILGVLCKLVCRVLRVILLVVCDGYLY